MADRRGDIDIFVEPLPWGNTPWIVDPEAYDGLIGRIVQSARQKNGYDVSIQLQLPNEWNPFLADFNIGMTAAVEADRCNPEWVAAVNRMDLVVVPSEFVKSVLTNSGKVTTRIEVIPESYIDEVADDSIPPLPLELETDFNFLVFGQVTGNNPENDRKNLFYTCKWLAEVFKDSPNIGVVIKTNTGRNTALDRIRTQNLFSQLLTEIQQGPGPKFYLLHGDMTNAEIAGLYKNPTIKAMVALTRGEGFGLPILEAAVAGLPVIATNWSAHTEYLSKGKFIKVDSTLGPIHETRIDGQIFVPNSKWAHPTEEDAKRKLRKFAENSSLPRQWAKDLSKTLKDCYSYSVISEQYTKVFDKI
jgi:glycosyltransferase involved in cell wall biosynthesis